MNLGTPSARGNTAKIYLYKNKIVKVCLMMSFQTGSPFMKPINKDTHYPLG